MVTRNPIPPPAEYVSPAGRPIWIDHKGLVLAEYPKAICEQTDTRGMEFVIYSFNERAQDAPDEEATTLGTGRTVTGAWRDAHLFITEPEECTCHKT